MTGNKSALLVMLLALLTASGYALFHGLDILAQSDLQHKILMQLRVPVVLTAALVGAALSVSSACLQVLLRNPLADPGIIGITSGASLLAALLLLTGGHSLMSQLHFWMPLMCFLGALFSTVLIYLLSRKIPDMSNAVILAGIAMSTLTGAVIAWLYLFSDAQSMRNLTFWLMGSLHQAGWEILALALPVSVLILCYLVSQGKALNWYYFGANNAQLAGVNIKTFNRNMLLACALLVGIAVSVAGSIAFVGLLVPHMLRLFFGFDNRFILPASALCGALLLMLVVIASDAVTGINIPVSMMTATLGGPVFLYSLIKLSRAR